MRYYCENSSILLYERNVATPMTYTKLKSILLKPDISLISILFIVLTCYYLPFMNRGLVTGDEGYSLHNAERILHGEVPYRDFFLQYPPGYFYLIAACFKLLGVSVLTGRLLTLVVCLGIFLTSLALLKSFGIASHKAKVLALFCIAAFGYPLINIPVVVWPTVLITELIMLQLMKLFQEKNLKATIFIGILIGLQFLIKQNIALVDMLFVNILLLVAIRWSFMRISQALVVMNGMWVVMTFLWIWYFFLRNNLSALFDLITFNKRYIGIYPFSYPPLSFLLQPLGFFKLLPYYLPFVFLLLLLATFFNKRKERKLIVLSLPIAGFFTTVYPTSDLLHVYPYFGLVLVSFLIFINSQFLRFQKLFFLLLFLCIGSGFYLTLFREYYRGQPPYNQENTALYAPRASGILIDGTSARNINTIYAFITSHTKANEAIFVYSFSPMLYFLLDRHNPSRYSIYYPTYLTVDEEKATIRDIQKKKVKYLIADWSSDFGNVTPLSAWISKKKKLRHNSQYTIIDAQK